jgi:hypothetical protein
MVDETGLEVGLVPTGVSGLGGEVEGAIEWTLSRLDGGGGGGPCVKVGFDVDDGWCDAEVGNDTGKDSVVGVDGLAFDVGNADGNDVKAISEGIDAFDWGADET